MDLKIVNYAVSAEAEGYHWSISDQTELLQVIAEITRVASKLSEKLNKENK